MFGKTARRLKKEEEFTWKLAERFDEIEQSIENLERLIQQKNSVKNEEFDRDDYIEVIEDHAHDLALILKSAIDPKNAPLDLLLSEFRAEKFESLKKDFYIKKLHEEIETLKKASTHE